MSTGPGIRAIFSHLPAYRAGRPAPALDGQTVYKLSSNENPYPPLPSVTEAVRDAANEMNRYPDASVALVREAIAADLDVPVERVACGPGSVGVLGQVIATMCDQGDEVVFAWRSFEAYPIVTALAGATAVPVPVLPDGRHDLPAMAAAVTERTRVVLVCTPNNPTGPCVGRAELEEFLAAVPQDVLVVIDEAYLEFVTDPDSPDALALHRRHGNVAVLRTFSKAYGLAGLRIGYAVAPEEVAAALRAAAVPFAVSTMAQVAAVASLQPAARSELTERVAAIVAERERVTAALAEQGWQLPVTQANFVWFPLGAHAQGFAEACEQAGIVVRCFEGDGVRATIAEPEANDRLVAVAAAWRDRTTR